MSRRLVDDVGAAVESGIYVQLLQTAPVYLYYYIHGLLAGTFLYDSHPRGSTRPMLRFLALRTLP